MQFYSETDGIYIDHCAVRVKMINYLFLSYKSVLYSADESCHGHREICKTHAMSNVEIVWQFIFADFSNHASVEPLPRWTQVHASWESTDHWR
jgi:hypothetical protein